MVLTFPPHHQLPVGLHLAPLLVRFLLLVLDHHSVHIVLGYENATVCRSSLAISFSSSTAASPRGPSALKLALAKTSWLRTDSPSPASFHRDAAPPPIRQIHLLDVPVGNLPRVLQLHVGMQPRGHLVARCSPGTHTQSVIPLRRGTSFLS